ncbi:MAG TPA: RNA polymerase factor sigma-32 [Candidatus Acidoferrales bacterium]|nr:RNA polymerase factor sigma-32 [Candidatus Acidoferrales bacterium]
MARKPAKSSRRQGGVKSGAKPARARHQKKAPTAAIEPHREDLDLERDDGIDAARTDDTAIEVSEFHPVESTDETAEVPVEATAATAPRYNEDESGAVVAYDPLSRYLAEIRRFPLLTREEELIISKRYKEKEDPADAYRLVTANLRLVVKIAYEFARATRNVLDLIQEGNVGLMEAVKNFDPKHDVRFPSYAVWWVRAYIYRYLINNWRLVKIGTTQAQRKLFFNLRKETERLERDGFKPQPLLLAHRMGVKESEVREMQERMGQSEVSLDQPTGASDESRLLDVIPDPENGPEAETADREWRAFAHDQVEQFAATLEGKELEIFKARLLTEDPATLQEIGARFGISRERVRQIETRLKRKLKEFIESKAPDAGSAGPS